MRRVRQVHRLDRRAELAGEFERGVERLQHARLDALAGQLRGDAELEALEVLCRRALDRLGQADARAVARVGADHRAEQQRAVGDVAGERAGLVERGRERDHPVAADRAVGRLHPDDPAQRGGLADRAAGVGADRPRGDAGGDGGRASTARTAGHARRVPRVERRAVGRVLGRRAHRELVLVGLAQQRPAGLEQLGARSSRCTAGGSPRGSSSRPGSGRPRCRRGP